MRGVGRAMRGIWRALGTAMFPGVTEWLLPTPSAVLFNALRVPPATAPPSLPVVPWSQRERRALQASSEERLRVIETKGPGLATAVAVIAAGVLVAIDTGWDASCWVGRLLLGGAAFYSAFSLCMPLYLVGPQRRYTLEMPELLNAAGTVDPEEQLAQDAAWAAAHNNRRNLILTNLQDAGRREAFYALSLLVAWAITSPLTGLAD